MNKPQIPRNFFSRYIENIALYLHSFPIWCYVCGGVHFATRIDDIPVTSIREKAFCLHCKSTNRNRQFAYLICCAIAGATKKQIYSLRTVPDLDNVAIYNTETGGVIHDRLSGLKGYVCSDYVGPSYTSGEMVDGRMHQNLMKLSFLDESFDLVLSSDVFEHISSPYEAHKEVFRILKKGGKHIFTVPFYSQLADDETLAVLNDCGTVTLLQEPEYHQDPLHPDSGIIVYTKFSQGMIKRLSEIGFIVRAHSLRNPFLGIFGDEQVVFEAQKPE